MATRQFCLCLSHEAAERIERIVAPYAGTVPGYAARFAAEMSRLPTTDQEEIRELIASKIRRLEAAGFLSAPKTPGAPMQLPSDTATLQTQVEPQRRQAHKRQSHRGNKTGSGGELHVVT